MKYCKDKPTRWVCQQDFNGTTPNKEFNKYVQVTLTTHVGVINYKVMIM